MVEIENAAPKQVAASGCSNDYSKGVAANDCFFDNQKRHLRANGKVSLNIMRQTHMSTNVVVEDQTGSPRHIGECASV